MSIHVLQLRQLELLRHHADVGMALLHLVRRGDHQRPPAASSAVSPEVSTQVTHIKNRQRKDKLMLPRVATNDDPRHLNVVLLDDVLDKLLELLDPGQGGDHLVPILVNNLDRLHLIEALEAVDGVLDLLFEVTLHQSGACFLLDVFEEAEIFSVRDR